MDTQPTRLNEMDIGGLASEKALYPLFENVGLSAVGVSALQQMQNETLTNTIKLPNWGN